MTHSIARKTTSLTVASMGKAVQVSNTPNINTNQTIALNPSRIFSLMLITWKNGLVKKINKNSGQSKTRHFFRGRPVAEYSKTKPGGK